MASTAAAAAGLQIMAGIFAQSVGDDFSSYFHFNEPGKLSGNHCQQHVADKVYTSLISLQFEHQFVFLIATISRHLELHITSTEPADTSD